MKGWLVFLLTLSFCANGTMAFAAEKVLSGKQIEMRWRELEAFLVREQVKLVLPDGTSVEGEALAVAPEALVVNVAKSSDRKAYPNGRTEFPRSLVNTIQMTQMKNARGRIGLTVTGLVAGLVVAAVAGYAAGESGDADGAAAGAVGALVGLPVAGYFAGRAIDTKQTLIRIVPD